MPLPRPWFSLLRIRKISIVARSVYVAVLPSLTATVVLACESGGISDDLVPDDSNSISSPPATTAEPAVATPTSSERASTLKELEVKLDARNNVMFVGNFCLPFDPAIDGAAKGRKLYSLPLVTEIHAGLTRVASGTPAFVENDLAASYTIDEDASKYRFTLRKDLKFSDGTPISASDVKWSWERALRLSTSWGRARSVLGEIAGADRVIAEAEWIRERERAAREVNPLDRSKIRPIEVLAGINIIDDLTFDVELVNPNPEFHETISDPVAYVLKESNVREWPVTWTNDVFPNVIFVDLTLLAAGQSIAPHELPVGAGPFKLVYSAPNEYPEKCAVARNEHYWDRASHLDGVMFVSPGAIVGQTEQQMFVNGDIDYVLLLPDNGGTALTSSATTLKTQRPPSSRFLALNPNHQPFDDVRIRRALLSSNDLDEVYAPIEVRWENTIVPHRLVPEYQHCERGQYLSPSHREVAKSSEYYEDLSDYTGEFWYIGRDHLTDRAQTLFDQWFRSVGFRAEIRDLDAGNHEEDLMRDGDVQIRLMEVSPDKPSVSTFFQSLIGVFGGEAPHQEWATVEKMIFDARQESDKATQFRKFREIECHLYDRALVLPMVVDWVDFEINVQPWVHDFALPRFNHSVFKDVWLDETAPTRELP